MYILKTYSLKRYLLKKYFLEMAPKSRNCGNFFLRIFIVKVPTQTKPGVRLYFHMVRRTRILTLTQNCHQGLSLGYGPRLWLWTNEH